MTVDWRYGIKKHIVLPTNFSQESIYFFDRLIFPKGTLFFICLEQIQLNRKYQQVKENQNEPRRHI